MAPDGLLQLLNRPCCNAVHSGLQLQEAAVGKARAGIGQGHRKAVHAGECCRPQVAVCWLLALMSW